MNRAQKKNWVIASLGGSLCSALSITFVFAIFGPREQWLFCRFEHWVTVMLLTTPAAVALAGCLCVWDVVLIRWRELPVGRRGWLSAAIAPPMVLGLYELYPPARQGYLSDFWLAIALPIVLSALVARLLLGTRRRA